MVRTQSADSEAGVTASEVVNVKVNFKCLHSLFKSSIPIPQQSIRCLEGGSCFCPEIVTLLFITRYQEDMSFLQLISRHANQKYDNPAFQQLEKCNLPSAWPSFKSEPREVNPTETDELDKPRRTYLKTRAASVNQGNLSRMTDSKALNPSKSQFHSSRGKIQQQCPSRRVDTKPRKREQQGYQVKYHHSFSNYLAKKHIGVRQGNLRSKFMYYDLNEIVHKISSPMRLEHKLQEDEQFYEHKEKKIMSLSHYQKFLREVNHQKNRYNQMQTSRDLKHKNSVDQKKDGYLEMILESRELRPKPKTLWLRQIVQKQIKQDHGIVPWLQNQEQNSPIKTKNRYSALGVEKPSSDDFQALLA